MQIHFGLDSNLNNFSKDCNDILHKLNMHGTQRMNPDAFDDPLTFPLSPQWGFVF